MQTEVAREFLRNHHRGVLATFRRDGRPQLSPVLTVVDEAGRAVISTTETTAKVRNLRRDARTTIVVFTDQFFGEWVQIEGDAEIVSLPQAMDQLIDYYRRAAGEHPDWDDYRRAMVANQRCVIQVTITRVGPSTALRSSPDR